MKWIVDFVTALGFTTITGSCLFLFWTVIGVFIKRMGYIHWLYRGLHWIVWLFLLPILYGILRIKYESNGAEGVFFLLTPEIEDRAQIAFEVWIIGLVVVMIYLICTFEEFHRRKWMHLETDIHLAEILEACKEKVGVQKKVTLERSYRTSIPLVYGWRNPRILIPVGQYSDRELEVILTHELIHIKNGDTQMQQLIILVVLLQWYNPFAWCLRALARRWSEYLCDFDVCQSLGNSREYFQIMIHIADRSEGRSKASLIALFEDKHQITRRMDRMVKNKRMVRKHGIVASILMCGILLGSTGTVLAATDQIVQEYAEAYEVTVVEKMEITSHVELEEFEESEDASRSRVEEGEVSSIARSKTSFLSWTVSSGVLKRTSKFSASSGGEITVSVSVDPTNVEIRAGIIEPDGTKRFVVGKKDISHTFALDQTGSYRVFFENKSDVDVTVDGYYTVR